jgi:hypothetical protein
MPHSLGLVAASLVLVEIGIALVMPRLGTSAATRVETVLHPEIQPSPQDVGPGQP